MLRRAELDHTSIGKLLAMSKPEEGPPANTARAGMRTTSLSAKVTETSPSEVISWRRARASSVEQNPTRATAADVPADPHRGHPTAWIWAAPIVGTAAVSARVSKARRASEP